MGKKRRTFSGREKFQIALEALREKQTLSEIAPKIRSASCEGEQMEK
jgi:transposase-like protein